MARHVNQIRQTFIHLTHASSLRSTLLFSKDPGTESGLAFGAGRAGLGRDDAAAGAHRDTNPFCFWLWTYTRIAGLIQSHDKLESFPPHFSHHLTHLLLLSNSLFIFIESESPSSSSLSPNWTCKLWFGACTSVCW